MDRGRVERLHSTDINGGAGHVGRWRWVGTLETLAGLAAYASAAGVPSSASQIAPREVVTPETELSSFPEDTDELLPV